MRWRFRYSLRSLMLVPVIVTGAMSVAHRWEPWVVERVLMGHKAPVISGAYSPDGQFIASGDADGFTRLWYAPTGESITAPVEKVPMPAELGGEADTLEARFTIDRGKLTPLAGPSQVTGEVSSEGSVEIVFNLLPKTRKHSRTGWHYEPSPDDTRVLRYEVYDDISPGSAEIAGSGEAYIDDVHSGRTLSVLEGHTWWILDGEFSPDGLHLITTDYGGTVRIWRRRHPEWWWGVAWFWEFWVTIAFAGLFLLSIAKDRKVLAAKASG